MTKVNLQELTAHDDQCTKFKKVQRYAFEEVKAHHISYLRMSIRTLRIPFNPLGGSKERGFDWLANMGRWRWI